MGPKTKVKVVYPVVEADRPVWPYINYDYQKRAKEITELLKENLPDIEFSPSCSHPGEEAEEIVKGEYDGYLLYIIGQQWSDKWKEVIKKGFPTVLVDDLYAGTGDFLKTYSYAKRENLPVVGIASSNFGDVINAVGLFEVIKSMKDAKIIDVIDNKESGLTPLASHIKPIKDIFGTEVLRMDSDDLNSYYNNVDESEAKEWADKWIDESLKVVEPSRNEIVKSAKMYLALKKAMVDKDADAVTIDCLGLYYSGKFPAYPCLAFFQLNNEGATGVCEADLDSTVTQLMMRYLTKRPGYVSDPVIDTASNKIIYAHCVGTNRVYGPDGVANPYIIRSHAEDRKGASVQSLMPLGERITTVAVDVCEKALSIHQGRTVANVEENKACRTKLAAEVDSEKILNNYHFERFAWHRVTVYGEWRREVINLAILLGLEVCEEDR